MITQLILRVRKTVLRNRKNLIFKNLLKHLKRKCFSDLRQKKTCSHGVNDGCKNLQHFSFKLLKPFCLSSEQGLNISKNSILNQVTKFNLFIYVFFSFFVFE